jgi:hypothetical protein
MYVGSFSRGLFPVTSA